MIQSSSEWKTRSNQEIAALKPRECGKRVALVRDLLIENSSRIRLEYLRPLVPPRWPVTDYQRCARRSERWPYTSMTKFTALNREGLMS